MTAQPLLAVLTHTFMITVAPATISGGFLVSCFSALKALSPLSTKLSSSSCLLAPASTPVTCSANNHDSCQSERAAVPR